MKTKAILLTLTAMLVIGFSGCKSGSMTYLPPCTGMPGEILLVLADDLYQGAVGDTITSLLTQEEPALPQSGMEGAESMFNVIHLPPSAFNNSVRSARNLVMVDVGSQITKPEVKVFKDYWADEQILIRINAPDRDQLIKLINDNSKVIVEVLRNGEVDRQVAYNMKFQNHDLAAQMLRNHEFVVKFPKGFEVKVDSGNFVWISYEPADIIEGILMWSYPYTSEKQLEIPELQAFTNQFLEPRVPGPSGPGKESFMRIVPDVGVISRTFNINGNFVVEMKGLWEVKVDWMGGPFISWTFVDEARNRIVTAFGFVYAPKTGKRNHVRRVEGLLKTIDFPDQTGSNN